MVRSIWILKIKYFVYLFITTTKNRLRLFRHFDPFRILVCSGDGSVGWVLSEIDRLGMHVSNRRSRISCVSCFIFLACDNSFLLNFKIYFLSTINICEEKMVTFPLHKCLFSFLWRSFLRLIFLYFSCDSFCSF